MSEKNVKVYDATKEKKAVERLIKETTESLNKLRDFTGYGRVLLGNHCVEIRSILLEDNKIEVTEIKPVRVSHSQGDLEFSKYIDLHYIKEIVRITNGKNKKDESINITFSKEVKEWLDINNIPDKLNYEN